MESVAAWIFFKVAIPLLLKYPITFFIARWHGRNLSRESLLGDGSLLVYATTLGWSSFAEALPVFQQGHMDLQIILGLALLVLLPASGFAAIYASPTTAAHPTIVEQLRQEAERVSVAFTSAIIILSLILFLVRRAFSP